MKVGYVGIHLQFSVGVQQKTVDEVRAFPDRFPAIYVAGTSVRLHLQHIRREVRYAGPL